MPRSTRTAREPVAIGRGVDRISALSRSGWWPHPSIREPMPLTVGVQTARDSLQGRPSRDLTSSESVRECAGVSLDEAQLRGSQRIRTRGSHRRAARDRSLPYAPRSPVPRRPRVRPLVLRCPPQRARPVVVECDVDAIVADCTTNRVGNGASWCWPSKRAAIRWSNANAFQANRPRGRRDAATRSNVRRRSAQLGRCMKCSKRAIDQRRGHLREIAHIAFSQIELDPGFGRTVSRLLEHRRG